MQGRACTETVLPGATPLVSDPAASGTQASDPRLVPVHLLPTSLPDAGMTWKEDPWFVSISVNVFLASTFRTSDPASQRPGNTLEAPGFARGTILPIHKIPSNEIVS